MQGEQAVQGQGEQGQAVQGQGNQERALYDGHDARDEALVAEALVAEALVVQEGRAVQVVQVVQEFHVVDVFCVRVVSPPVRVVFPAVSLLVSLGVRALSDVVSLDSCLCEFHQAQVWMEDDDEVKARVQEGREDGDGFYAAKASISYDDACDHGDACGRDQNQEEEEAGHDV